MRFFQIAEDKLHAFLDASLKVGGMLLHGHAAQLIAALKEVPPPSEPSAPSAPSSDAQNGK